MDDIRVKTDRHLISRSCSPIWATGSGITATMLIEQQNKHPHLRASQHGKQASCCRPALWAMDLQQARKNTITLLADNELRAAGWQHSHGSLLQKLYLYGKEGIILQAISSSKEQKW